MKKNILIVLVLMVSIVGFAQQEAQYTQYMYNMIDVNPAYAGNRGVTSVFGLYRTQWVGLEGAPVTNNISVNTPIANSDFGLGLSFKGDKIGASDENNISADLAYSINTSPNYKLSVGLKATAELLTVDYTKLDRYDSSDPKFQNNINNKFSPNLGAGLFFNSDKLYLGLSVPNFFNSRHFDDNSSATLSQKMHYYFMGGYVFDLSPNIKFKPAFLNKIVQGAPAQLDLSGNFLFNEKFVLGAAWRWGSAASMMAGFQISESLFIGYGYDLETTNLNNYNSGSHEIFLRFDFMGQKDSFISPRFF